MGSSKRKEFEELTQKQMGDFNNFEKMEIGMIIQNMQTTLENLKAEIN